MSRPALLTAAHEAPQVRVLAEDRLPAHIFMDDAAITGAAGAPLAQDPPVPPLDVEVIPRRRAGDPDDAAAPSVRLEESGGAPVPLSAWYSEIVERCLDTAAMLARHRTERRADERADEEARLLELVDAVAAIGSGAIEETLAWSEASLESPDPWKVFAPLFVLGCLPGDHLEGAAASVLEALPPDAVAPAKIAAEALAVAPHPDRAELAQALRRSQHPVLRGVGVDLASHLGALHPDALPVHLADPGAPVLAAAARAVVRGALAPARAGAPADPRLPPLLHALVRHPSVEVAWEACRALARLGRPDPYEDARADPALFAALGACALDLLVLFGDAADLALFEAALRRGRTSAAHLSAVARFGHPRSWAFLAHFLGDEDLAEDAALALEVVFGERVPRPDRYKLAAWRAAVAAGRFTPDVRLRRGEPWSLATVSAELARGKLSRAEMEALLDEAAVRAGLPLCVDLMLWLPDAAPALRAAQGSLSKAHTMYPAGSFECRTRRRGWPSARREDA